MEDDTGQSAQDFSWNETAASVLARIDMAFAPVHRPAHFTDVDHCFECRDHDEELSARPRPELLRSDLGSMCWDPVTASIPQGVAYLMPTLARYTMGPDLWAVPGWYAEQMAFHLTHGEQGNRLLRFFNEEQRAAVSVMIDWMIEERAEDLKSNCLEDDWLQARSLWRG
jgi:hypothetical protein